MKGLSMSIALGLLVFASSCRTPQTGDSGSEIKGTGSVSVPEELKMELKEDISGEFHIKDLIALKDKMVSDPAVAKPITMDRFMEELKKDPRARPMFSFFTAVYQSGSRQSGTPRHPRVIMATESGSLTVTFSAEKEVAGPTLQNGMTLAAVEINPKGGQPGAVVKLENGDQLEAIQVDPVTLRKDFYQIYFPFPVGSSAGNLPASVKATGMAKNPALCAGCHNHTAADSLTHMWGRYPIWKGVLGGTEDFLSDKKGTFVRNQALLVERFGAEFAGEGNDCPDGEQKVESTDVINDEVKILQNLRQMVQTGEPVYRHLDFPADAPPLYPFDDVPRGKFKSRPNFRLGALWHRLHVRNLMQEAKAADFPTFKYLYLYGFFECSEAVGEQAEAAMREKYAVRYRDGTVSADVAKSKIGGFKKSSYNSVSWMNAGLSEIGASLETMTIEFDDVSKFAYKSGYFPGGDSSDRYMAAILVRDDVKSPNPLPENLYSWEKTPICNEKMGLNDYPYLRWFGFRPEPASPEAKLELCQLLMKNLGVAEPAAAQP